MTFLLIALAVAIFGQLLKRLFELAGLPNLPSFGKDLVIIAAFAAVLLNTSFTMNYRALTAYVVILFLACFYLFLAALDGRTLVGLYFLRIYILPLIFLAACSESIPRLTPDQLKRLLVITLCVNLLVCVAAIGLYVALYNLPSAKLLLLGPGELRNAWTLAGANLLRMGLPLTGPNILGCYIAISLIAIQILLLSRIPDRRQSRTLYALWVLNIGVLLFTFSRSSVITWILGTLLTMMVIGNAFKHLVGRIVIAGLATGIAVLIVGLVGDYLTQGRLERWIELNVTLSDPSIIGHASSVGNAILRFEEYYITGYGVGTVGPKANIFSTSPNNVENSVLALIFDFGLFGALAYLAVCALLLHKAYVSRYQLPLLLAAIVNVQFLPNIYEIELMLFIYFTYVLVGAVALQGTGGAEVKGRMHLERSHTSRPLLHAANRAGSN